MTKTPRDPNGNGTREARLKAALRANLARRKAQGRARAPDDDGIAQGGLTGTEKKKNGRAPENEE